MALDKLVSSEEAGIRLDRCLRLWMPTLPQSVIERTARKGGLRVDGVKAKPSFRVTLGQKVSFPDSFPTLGEATPPPPAPYALSQAERKWLKSLILFENDDILVVNKPPGVAVQKGTKQRTALDEMMKVYDPSFTPRLVHRLDQDTSGVLVFAKTLPMARWLTKAFKERTVQKTYWALVCGLPVPPKGVISLALSKKQDPVWEKVQVDREEGLNAVTHYQVLKTLQDRFALLELKPRTGRTHQLRVHCATGLKTPILGDGKYGGKLAVPLGRTGLHLHAHALTLPLPEGGTLTLDAPLPEGFQGTLDQMS